MYLLELVQADGLKPKRVASTNGGEYHSPCPNCGGRDRFIIWDKMDRYFCRQCEKKGDLIQYLRDFHAYSYSAACAKIGLIPKAQAIKSSYTQLEFEPKPSYVPPALWRQKAEKFIEDCHKNLFSAVYPIRLVFERGFIPRTMNVFRIGWNPKTIWIPRSDWGLSDEENRKIWFPRGLVLPVFDLDTREPIKLKIRRDDWEKNDELPKYVEIPGSMQTPGRYGDIKAKPIILLESEFDAMLVQQMAGDLVSCMALGGASKRPDVAVHELLKTAPLIIFALDVDSAGAVAFRWWSKIYPQIKLWLPPIGKSPGDAHKRGIDLRKWLIAGLDL